MEFGHDDPHKFLDGARETHSPDAMYPFAFGMLSQHYKNLLQEYRSLQRRHQSPLDRVDVNMSATEWAKESWEANNP